MQKQFGYSRTSFLTFKYPSILIDYWKFFQKKKWCTTDYHHSQHLHNYGNFVPNSFCSLGMNSEDCHFKVSYYGCSGISYSHCVRSTQFQVTFLSALKFLRQRQRGEQRFTKKIYLKLKNTQ